jgi:hypothetical protein
MMKQPLQKAKTMISDTRARLELAMLRGLFRRLLAIQSAPTLTTLTPEAMQLLVMALSLQGAASVTAIPHRDLIDNATQLGNRVKEYLEMEIAKDASKDAA